MNLAITINGVDKTTLINWRSLSVNDIINAQASEAQFSLICHANQTYRPAIRDEVIITDGATKVFAGKILSIKDRVEGKISTISISAKDYTAELDRVIVTDNFTSQTVNQIITSLVADYLAGTGITMTNVACTTLITTASFNSIPLSQVIQILAEQVNYSWYIDYDKDIHFFARNTEMAPFNLDDSSGNFIWDSLELEQDISQLRNVVIVRGGDKVATVARPKNHVGDANQKTFNTDYQFNSKPTVTVGGVSKTVGLENIDQDASFDCLWDYNQKYIRFVAAPAAAAAVTITGYPLIPIFVQVEDAASIGQNGRHEFKKTDKSINSAEEAKQYADAQLEAYGNSVREGNFRTYTSGLSSGQTINITVTDRNISETFVIQSVTLSMYSANNGIWSVELATLRTVGIIDFLQKLLTDQTRQITIDSNEKLEKYYEDNQTAQVTEEVSLKVAMQDYQTAQVTEEITKDPFGAGVKPDFVLAPYVVTGQTDKSREFFLDASPLR